MKIIDELSVSCGFSLSDETKNTIASFYSHGFVGTIKDWIESKCEVDPSIMSSLMKKYDKQSITTITGAISKVIKGWQKQ